MVFIFEQWWKIFTLLETWISHDVLWWNLKDSYLPSQNKQLGETNLLKLDCHIDIT